jgi:regulator of nucleoside diphosphate kinase
MDLNRYPTYKRPCGYDSYEFTRRRHPVTRRRIELSRADLHRLRSILGTRTPSARDREHLLDLQQEIDEARIVEAHDIAHDVVTMQSDVRVHDAATGVSSDYRLVSPAQADLAAGRLSVLAPLGTALLGYREGDEVEWQMPGGVRLVRIEKVSRSAEVALDG